ncbi:unnamed protein product [Aphanomyces euteiches]
MFTVFTKIPMFLRDECRNSADNRLPLSLDLYDFLMKRVEAGFHLERTGPFPFVNYPEGVFEMPEWMRAQQSTEANFVGKWVSLPGRPVVMDQTDGSFLVGSDVSGQGSADGPTTL